MKQVAGGIGPDNGIISDWCPFCGEYIDFYIIKDYSALKREFWHCGKCGDLTHFTYPTKEGHWEHGIILD